MKKLCFLHFALIVGLLSMAGCWGHGHCYEVDCSDQGECVEGDCVCDTGYEGVDCQVPWNAKFNGSYYATQVCDDTTNALSDTILVTPRPSTLDDIYITGLWELPQSTVIAEVKYDGVSFEIARQAISASHEISATGISNASGTAINLSYKIFALGDTAVFDSCHATLQR
jgi:hypothetical protein